MGVGSLTQYHYPRWRQSRGYGFHWRLSACLFFPHDDDYYYNVYQVALQFLNVQIFFGIVQY